MEQNQICSFDSVQKIVEWLVEQINNKDNCISLGQKLIKENCKNIPLARKTALEIHSLAKRCGNEKQKLLLRCLGHCVACIHTPLHVKGVNFYLAKLQE